MKNEKIKFIVPFIQDYQISKKIIKKHGNVISKIYGGFNDLQKIGIEKFNKIAQEIISANIEFCLTISQRGKKEGEKINFEKINYSKLIISDQNDLKSIPQNSKIYISTITAPREIDKFQSLINKWSKRNQITDISLHHDSLYYCEIKEIKNCIKKLSKKNIKANIMINESCYYKCPFRAAHYNLCSVNKKDDLYQDHCIDMRIRHPEQIINLSGFVHPSHINEIAKLTNIQEFKITGRFKDPSVIQKIINHYHKRTYPKNLLKLLTFTKADGNEGPIRFFLDGNSLAKNKLWLMNQKEKFNLGKKLIQNKKIKILNKKNIKSNPHIDMWRWDNYWKKIKDPWQTPWANIPIPLNTIKKLDNLNKKQKIIAPGCGAGTSVYKLYKIGFQNIDAYDISSYAIKLAQQLLPHINFIQSNTIDIEFNKKDFIFDWMNLHDLPPNIVQKYLNKIKNNSFLISYLLPNTKRKSHYVCNQKIYKHDLKKIKCEKININFKKDGRNYKAILMLKI